MISMLFICGLLTINALQASDTPTPATATNDTAIRDLELGDEDKMFTDKEYRPGDLNHATTEEGEEILFLVGAPAPLRGRRYRYVHQEILGIKLPVGTSKNYKVLEIKAAKPVAPEGYTIVARLTYDRLPYKNLFLCKEIHAATDAGGGSAGAGGAYGVSDNKSAGSSDRA